MLLIISCLVVAQFLHIKHTDQEIEQNLLQRASGEERTELDVVIGWSVRFFYHLSSHS